MTSSALRRSCEACGTSPGERPPARTSELLRPRLTSPWPFRGVADAVVRLVRTGGEISQGKSWLLRSVLAGFTTVRVRMTIGHPRPLPGYPTTLALYPVSVRRVRVGGVGFLRIPSRDGHPCLALRFRFITARGGLAPPHSRHAWHTTTQAGSGPACLISVGSAITPQPQLAPPSILGR